MCVVYVSKKHYPLTLTKQLPPVNLRGRTNLKIGAEDKLQKQPVFRAFFSRQQNTSKKILCA